MDCCRDDGSFSDEFLQMGIEARVSGIIFLVF
jgi:hypothetical protein